jgi:cell division protein FtsN
MSRYFEIIITGRQLAALIAGVALLIVVAFGLGVAVRLLQPAAAPHEMIAAAPAAAPVVAPTAPAAVPTVAPTPQPAPTVVPPAPPAPPPVETEKAKTHVAAPAAAPSAPGRWVQVAAFAKHEQAEGVKNRVVALGFTPKQAVVEAAGSGKFRVRVGPFPDGESAGRVAARLRAEGFGGAFVVRPGE